MASLSPSSRTTISPDWYLRGRIAVLVRGGPSDMPSPLKAHFQSPEERVKALRAAGAVGAVSIPNPKIPELPWPRLASGLLMPRMELREAGPGGYRPLSVNIAFNPESAGALFEGSGHTWEEVLGPLGTARPLARFPLAVRIRGRVGFSRRTAKCHNVVGVLPGSDPQLKNEYIVVSAHLDHLGIGTPINGDPVYHGAIDNASGVASITRDRARRSTTLASGLDAPSCSSRSPAKRSSSWAPSISPPTPP